MLHLARVLVQVVPDRGVPQRPFGVGHECVKNEGNATITVTGEGERGVQRRDREGGTEARGSFSMALSKPEQHSGWTKQTEVSPTMQTTYGRGGGFPKEVEGGGRCGTNTRTAKKPSLPPPPKSYIVCLHVANARLGLLPRQISKREGRWADAPRPVDGAGHHPRRFRVERHPVHPLGVAAGQSHGPGHLAELALLVPADF